MSLGGSKIEEKVVPGGLSPEMLSFCALCHLHQWAAGCGGRGYPEKDSNTTHNKVSATLIKDVRIRQEWDCHKFGAGHTPVHPGSRVPSNPTSVQSLQWEDDTGINLF